MGLGTSFGGVAPLTVVAVAVGFAKLNIIASREKIALALAGAAAFGLSVADSFHFDDYSLLAGNIWRTLATRPLTAAIFWVNREIADAHPALYHVINLGLHLAAAILLFDALRRLLPERAAFVSALIFAIHPIQAEAVNYVFARGTLLDTLLCIAALACWLRDRHWTAAALFAAALAAKEECVSFPLFLLLLYLSISRNARELRAIAVMLALSMTAGVWVLVLAGRTPGSQAGTQASVSAASYFFTQAFVILRYLRLLIVTAGFNADPDIHPVPAYLGIALWIALAAASAAAMRWFSRARPGFWFLGGLVLLLPSSSIFPASDLAADRRMYLPMIAFSTCAGLLLARLRPAGIAVIAALLIAFSVQRTLVWRTEQSLWTDAERKSPQKIRPKLQLARVVDRRRALELLTEAREISPNDPRVATETGRVYLESGDAASALSAFGHALALQPNDPEALNNRGVALLLLGQVQAATQDFERALRINPCQPDARANLRRLGVRLPDARGCE